MLAIDFPKILNNKEAPAFLREIVKTYQETSQVTVGGWLKSVSTLDLHAAITALRSVVERRPGSFTHRLGELPSEVGAMAIALVDIFSSGEGLDIKTDGPTTVKRFSLLEMYLSMEMLRRKGFDIRLNYENMSLNEESDGTETLPIIDTSFEGCKLKDQFESIFTNLEPGMKMYPISIKAGLGPKDGEESWSPPEIEEDLTRKTTSLWQKLKKMF